MTHNWPANSDALPLPQARTQRHQIPVADTAAQFAVLNYGGVAMNGQENLWQTHAARALVRGYAQDFQNLAQFGAQDAQLHCAAAQWIAGDEDAAARILEQLPSQHARNLLQLIRQPKIKILAQLPWTRKAPHDLLSAAKRDSKFELRNISFHSEDHRNQPRADVHQFVDSGFQPDLYLSAMVEWHVLPPNLQELNCPIIGQTADYDLHSQVVHPWLQLFDELITTDPGEWSDVSGIVEAPVSSFPKVFGIREDLPPVPNGSRDLDFFISGTLLDPMHPDKVAHIHEVLGMPDINLRVLRGFVCTEAYQALLGNSRASFSFIRRPGATPTRGLETLAMGCALALQQESMLNLFVGENEGIARYAPGPKNLSACIRHILDNWPQYAAGAQRGAEIVRREFALSRVASQYLRYVTFRAAAPRGQRRLQRQDQLAQQRTCVRVGWLPEDLTDRRHLMQSNVRVLNDQITVSPSACGINRLAREFLLEYAFYDHDSRQATPEPEMLDQAISVLKLGQRAFPTDLALRFNLIRAAIHFGDEEEKSDAYELAMQTLHTDLETWQLPTMADVLPIDFFGEHFHYRAYLDLITTETKEGDKDCRARAKLVLASISGYLARHTKDVSWYEHAAALDPAFAPFQLALARSLIDPLAPDTFHRGVAILRNLAVGSVEFYAASEQLESLVLQGKITTVEDSCIRLPMQRIHESSITTRQFTQAIEPNRISNSDRETRLLRNRLRKPSEYPLSILIPCSGSKTELSALLTDLRFQSEARSFEYLVALPADASEEQSVIKANQEHLSALRTIKVPANSSYHERLNLCVTSASGACLTIASPGDRFSGNAYERLLEALDTTAHIAVIYADQGNTTGVFGSFELSACDSFLCLPEFSRRRMFAGEVIGDHAVWRASVHAKHGLFDTGFGAASEYEFWLRIAGAEGLRHYPGVVTSSPAMAPCNAIRSATSDLSQFERARIQHWPSTWGELPTTKEIPWLPAMLFASPLRTEAESLQGLGVISKAETQEIDGLSIFYEYSLHRLDFHCAELALRACVKRYPQVLGGHLRLAELVRYLHGNDKSAEVLEAAQDCNPFLAIVQKRLGVCYHAQGQVQAAEDLFQRAQRAAPRDVGVLINLGTMCLNDGRNSEAKGHFENVLRIDSHSTSALSGLELAATAQTSMPHSTSVEA